jgi:hypothetical protein
MTTILLQPADYGRTEAGSKSAAAISQQSGSSSK